MKKIFTLVNLRSFGLSIIVLLVAPSATSADLQAGGNATFSATVSRIIVPDGVAPPKAIEVGLAIAGSLSLQSGVLRDDLPDNYHWRIPNSRKFTGAIELDSPLSTDIGNLRFSYSPSAMSLNFTCSYNWCKSASSLTIDGEQWIPNLFSLVAPDVEIRNPEDLEQKEALEELSRIVDSGDVTAIISYIRNPDDSANNALKVIMEITDMEIQ